MKTVKMNARESRIKQSERKRQKPDLPFDDKKKIKTYGKKY